jgi:hypothetical protein
MTPASLPENLAERAEWEYPEPASGEALAINKWGHISFATGVSGETNTLANPLRAGIRIALNCRSHGGGNRVITAAGAVNRTGNTVMTFSATRQNLVLESIKTATDTYRWQIVANDGVGLS